MATHGSRNTCVILLLSIILMMINHCEAGSLSSSKRYAHVCNGTMAACLTLVEVDEEFLMDSEEHRQILEQTTPHISQLSLEKDNAACVVPGCNGAYNTKGKGRPCISDYHCPH
ncbi:hypothetical protein L1987_68324 [Smallanthus sonchifolius]|uniref:Uncharacterized protein n=1 Tax=Smallanthus sonchifolius TaxID=185202 RepID=A0ACB9B477_9ASTR|nr:hypothetical protein L1987_68324 [Smallanthus sonchifolius]